MQEALGIRVLKLEQAVEQQATVRDLTALQAALSAQILQLGSDMRGEFSALRGEIRAGDAETREVLRGEIRTGDAETREVLRGEIRTGDEETRGLSR